MAIRNVPIHVGGTLDTHVESGPTRSLRFRGIPVSIFKDDKGEYIELVVEGSEIPRAIWDALKGLGLRDSQVGEIHETISDFSTMNYLNSKMER